MVRIAYDLLYVLDTWRNEKHNLRFLTSLLPLPDDVRAKIWLRREEKSSSTLHFDKTTNRSVNVQRAQVYIDGSRLGAVARPAPTQNIITETIDTKCASNEQVATATYVIRSSCFDSAPSKRNIDVTSARFVTSGNFKTTKCASSIRYFKATTSKQTR